MSTNLLLTLNTAIGLIAITDGTNVVGVNSDGSLNVRVLSGGGGGGSNPAAGPTGSAVPADADYEGVSVGGTLQGVTGLSLGTKIAPTVAIVDGSGNQIVSFGGGAQYADAAAWTLGTVAMGNNAGKAYALQLDAADGNLLVKVNAALPTGTNVIGHVIVDSFGTAIDVTDRAGRLVGVVYGSQAQQLKQTPTNFNLQVELATGSTLYDARQIRTLTAADVVTVSPNPLPVNLEVSGTPLTYSFDGSPAIASLNVHLTNALPLLVQDSSAVGLDGIASPSTFLLVGGRTVDSSAEYDAIPLAPEARAVIVEGSGVVGAVPVSVNWTAAQHVIVDSGGGGGQQYADLNNSTGAPTGTLAMGWDAQTLKIRALQVSPNTGILEVDIEASNTPLTVSMDGSPVVASLNVHVTNSPSVSFTSPQHVIVDSGGGGGIQYADSAASLASPTGTLAMAWDSINLKILANHADTTGSLFINNAGQKKTYSASIVFNPTGGSPLSPMDIATIFGTSGKIIRVTRVEVSLMTTGIAAVDEVQLSMRSTANTKGVGTAMPSAPHDFNDPNSTATVIYWTQPPSQGTHVAYIRGAFFNDQSSAIPGAATWLWTFGDGRGGTKELTFRNATQGLAVVVGAVSTQYAIVSFEWTEE